MRAGDGTGLRQVRAALILGTAALSLLFAAPGAAAASGVMAWGYNEYGELGNGTSTRSTTPVAVSGLTGGIRAISAGTTFGLALLKSGTVKAWGANEYGQLGNGSSTGPETCASFEPCSETPVAVSGLSGVTAVAGGGGHSLALLSDSTVMAWGLNEYGELGNGTTTGPSTCGRFPFRQPCSTTPEAVTGLSGVVAVSALRASLALLSDGTVRGWGNNEYGQIGDGSTADRDVPVSVSGLSGVVAISAGTDHSLALLSDGTVKAWGLNNDGQLGNGTTTNSTTPVTVSGLSGVVAIAAGGFHSLALLSDGTVMAWGSNGNGQLGTPSLETCGSVFTCSKTPLAVNGLSGVTAISAGLAHSLALESDGAMMSWGWNNEGQLGNGAVGEDQPAPGPVVSVSGVSTIAAGAYFSLAYSPPPPTVTAVSPAEGAQAGGTSVSISGTEFTGTTAVKFGSTEAKSFKVNSDSSITATSPAGTGTVDVTVTNAVGTSATSSADQFTYVHVASEDLPEFGRCVKVSSGKGAFTRRSCVPESVTHTGAFEWMPGPGPKPGFTIAAGATTLETAKARISCASGQFSGEFTGTKTETLNVTFSGCHDIASKPCQSSPATAGEISTTQALEGELGFIRAGLRPKVGVDVKPKSPATTILTFECREGPEAGTHVLIEGSVIGQDKTLNHMASHFKLLYKAAGTRQIPEKFETGLKDTLSATFTSTAGQTGPEAAGLTMLGAGVNYITGTTQEPIEVKAKV
jgi:alpha-tubulin suppressor-like RCC1 family protein